MSTLACAFCICEVFCLFVCFPTDLVNVFNLKTLQVLILKKNLFGVIPLS